MAQKLQADFLALITRLLPASYLEPLKDPGPGFATLQADGAIFERISLAVERLRKNLLIIQADAASKAIVPLEISRPTSAAGALVITRDSQVVATASNRRFQLLNDVTFSGAALGPIAVTAKAVLADYTWNMPGPVTTADGTTLPGEVDAFHRLVTVPSFADPTLIVVQTGDAVGGACPGLESLGEDRGLPRRAGESDAAYRNRIRQLLDTVSPDAIERAVALLLGEFNATFDFIETFELDYQSCWDGPPTAVGDYDPNLCHYDPETVVGYDPLPFRNRWLDEVEARGAFIVVVPDIGAVLDVGMSYDDTATGPSDHTTPAHGGKRSHSAYDVPEDADAIIVQGGYDGFDLPKQALYQGLFELLQRIKPAGSAAIIELEGQ